MAVSNSVSLCIRRFASLLFGVTAVFATDVAFAAISPSGGDDTAAISQAINNAAPGDVVELGEGKFLLSAKLILDKDVRLVGAGKDKTILDFGQKCCGFSVTHDSALLKGVCVTNCYGQDSSEKGVGAYLLKGRIEACRFTGAIGKGGGGGAYGGGVYLEGGTLADSELDNNQGRCSFTTEGNAIYMTGASAIVTNCNIHSHNAACIVNGDLDNSTATVYMRNGLLVGCRIHDNRVADNANRTAKYARGGVRIDGGTILNCLIYNNYSMSYSAGVYMKNGTLAYSTIYGNEVKGDSTGCSGLRLVKGTVCNNIIYGNGPDGTAFGSVEILGGTFATNVTELAVNGHPLNVNFDPRLRDPANGDFTIRSRASSAYAAGAPITQTNRDIDGALRSATAPTIGAHEYEIASETLGCDIRIETSNLKVGATGAAEAIVSGAGDADATFAWYLDNELVSNAKNATFANMPPGVHQLRLAVNCLGHQFEATETQAFDIHPTRVFANLTGSAEYPYDTEEKGTSDLFEAYKALWRAEDDSSEMVIGSGTFTLSTELHLATPVAVRGTGTNETFLTGTSLATRMFTVEHDDAMIHDICFSNLTGQGNGLAVYVTNGEVRRCKFYNCKPGYQSANLGIAAYISGGLLADSTFEKCEPYSWFGGRGVVYAAGGIVSNVTLQACTPGNYTDSSMIRGTALYLKNGLVTDARVIDCGDASKSGVRAVVLVENGTLQNSLVCGNKAKGNDSAGIYQSGGTVQFCTIYGNVAEADTSGCSGLCQIGGTARYNVIIGNGTSSSGSCLISGAAVFMGNVIDKVLSDYPDNTTAAPDFADAANRDFHPANAASPLVDKVEPVAGYPLVDIDGMARDAMYDIGAYEYDKSMATFSVDISLSSNEWKPGATVSALAVVEGAPSSEIAFLWKLDGNVLSDTTAEIELDNLSCGTHSLYVQATSGGQSVEKDKPDILTVKPLEVFVSQTGCGEYPYDTPAKATPSIESAWDAIWKGGDTTGVVHIAEGTYSNQAGITITTPIRILGAGRGLTQLTTGEGFVGDFFAIKNPDAYLSGVTLTNLTLTSAKAIVIESGLVENIEIKGVVANTPTYSSTYGMVNVSGGILRNALVEDVLVGVGDVYGAGLGQSGGLVSNCIFRACFSQGSKNDGYSYGGCVHLSGGTNVCCLYIEGGYNSAGDRRRGGGAGYIAGTAVVRNCLFARNSHPNGCPGLEVASATAVIENCTIADNSAGGSDNRYQLLYSNAATVRNTIICSKDDATGDLSNPSGANVTYSRFKEAVWDARCNLSTEVKFRKKGEYQIGSSSPLAHAGENREYMGYIPPIGDGLTLLCK